MGKSSVVSTPHCSRKTLGLTLARLGPCFQPWKLEVGVERWWYTHTYTYPTSGTELEERETADSFIWRDAGQIKKQHIISMFCRLVLCFLMKHCDLMETFNPWNVTFSHRIMIFFSIFIPFISRLFRSDNVHTHFYPLLEEIEKKETRFTLMWRISWRIRLILKAIKVFWIQH